MNRYEKYKPTNIEWIGIIPEHWSLKKIKYSASINDDVLSETTDDTFEIIYVEISSIQNGKIVSKQRYQFSEAPSRARRKVKHGDVIVSTVRTYLKAIARIENPEDNLIVSTGFSVIRPREIKSEYLGNLFFSEHLIDEIISRSVGVSYPAINSSEIGDIKIPIPPIAEQTFIANYLDEKTTQIDKLIGNKQRLIELLKEERTVIINKAVSGEGKNWERKKLKYVANLKSGDSITSDSIRPEGDYPVFGGNGLRGYTSKYTHEGVYVLIGRQGALCGNVNYANGKFFASEHAVVVTPLYEGELIWLGELLRSMNLNQYSIASAQPGLSVERIQNLSIAVPSIQEQRQIATFIQYETQRIDNTVSKIETEIELIMEYKGALINEVVTGKQKVIRKL